MKQPYFRFIETQQNDEGVTSFIILAFTAEQKAEAQKKFYNTMSYIVDSKLPFHSAELFDSAEGINILYGDNR